MITKGQVERACRAALMGLADYPAGLGCYLVADQEEQVRPCVVVECFRLEDPEEGGNQWCHVRVLVKSEGDRQEAEDDMVTEHDDRVEAVIGSLLTPDEELATDEEQREALATLISEAEEDFTVLGLIHDGGDPDLDGRAFVDAHMFRLYCMGRDAA